MRISDWSSDVCSSDLAAAGCWALRGDPGDRRRRSADPLRARPWPVFRQGPVARDALRPVDLPEHRRQAEPAAGGGGATGERRAPRSEEHTSELQSLMRISYAVFCLKKKKTTKEQIHA